MPRLPSEIDTRDAIKVFAAVGFTPHRRVGSHETLKRPGPKGTVTVRHPTMRVGLLKSLLRDAGMTAAEFMSIYDAL